MKKFVAYWGEGYTESAEVFTFDQLMALYAEGECNLEWTTRILNDMQVKQVEDFSDLSGTHYVLRVE
jgi:hypothetical protein